MPEADWGWADVERVNVRSKARSGTDWKHVHGADRLYGGRIARFLGGGAHFATEAEASLSAGHPALIEARSLFPKSLRDPAVTANVLKSGVNNAKIGKFVTRGNWKGMPIYTLTLEERATCPPDCHLWASCYGNAMPYAHRHKHGPALPIALHQQLRRLAFVHPRGFVVRLHVLGDFYSVGYAAFWLRVLQQFSALRIYGYTHWPPDSPIGQVIRRINALRWTKSGHHSFIRFTVRAEQAPAPMTATTIWRQPEASVVPEGHVCPASLGVSVTCGTCGLCWSPDMVQETIVFPGHGMRGANVGRAGRPRAAAEGGDHG